MFRIVYTDEGRRYVPFPENARGFLYLHSPAEVPKALWEIRFRVTDTNCPSTFNSGLDLLFPNQTPWAISFSAMHARNKKYLPLRQLLTREGLDVDNLANIPVVKRMGQASRPLVYSLGQRFRLNFKNTTIQPIFISFSAEEKLDCYIRFLSLDRGPSPYTGVLHVTSLGLC